MEIPIIHFKFANNQIVMVTKKYRRSNKSKEITYEDIKDLVNNSNLNQYGMGSYLEETSTPASERGLQKAASSVPIWGAFAAIGTAGGQALTQRDEYGIAQGSAGAQAVGNFIDPITVAQDLQKEGKAGQAALSVFVPGAASIFGKRLNDRKKKLLRQKQIGEDIQRRGMEQINESNLNDPTYSAIMKNGGKVPDKKYYVNSPSGKVDISPEELEEVKLYLDAENDIRNYYKQKYSDRLEKYSGGDSYSKYIADIENDITSALPAESYESFKKILPENKYNAFIKYRNKFIPSEMVSGKLEGTKSKASDTLYGGKNYFLSSQLGDIVEENVKTPPKDIAWEPYRGYAGINIGYENIEGKRTPTTFRNAYGREVPINPKRGMDPNSYPELTKEFQYEVPIEKIQYKFGGTIDYSGQTHDGPNGGVPVDGMGNPNKANPSALVEKGEVSYNTPDGGTYIYSDTLKYSKDKTFASKAKDIKGRYKFRMKNGVINDPYTKKAYDAEMLQLQDEQEQLREFTNMKDNIPNGNLPEGKNGIYIKPENRGKFNATKERTGKTTEELTHSKNPLTRKRAIFAKNAAKWNKEYGGDLPMYWDGSTLPKGSQEWAMVQNPENFSTAYEDLNAMLDRDNQSFKNYLIYSEKYKDISKPTGVKSAPVNQMRKDLGISTPNNNIQSTPYQGMNWGETAMSAAGPILSGLTGLLAEVSNKRKPREVRLGRLTPQQVNMEPLKRSLIEEARLASTNLGRGLRMASPTTGAYLSNLTAGTTDINRNLDRQLSDIYTNEALMNAQYRQQADMANLESGNQEEMYNTQLKNINDAQKKAAMNAYLSQIGQGVTSAISQRFQSQRDADYLNAINPDYQMTTDVPANASWWQRNMAINRRRRWTPRPESIRNNNVTLYNSLVANGKPIPKWLQDAING